MLAVLLAVALPSYCLSLIFQAFQRPVKIGSGQLAKPVKQKKIKVNAGDVIAGMKVEIHFVNFEKQRQVIKINYLTCFRRTLDGDPEDADDFLKKVKRSNTILRAILVYIGQTDNQMISESLFCIT